MEKSWIHGPSRPKPSLMASRRASPRSTRISVPLGHPKENPSHIALGDHVHHLLTAPNGVGNHFRSCFTNEFRSQTPSKRPVRADFWHVSNDFNHLI